MQCVLPGLRDGGANRLHLKTKIEKDACCHLGMCRMSEVYLYLNRTAQIAFSQLDVDR